MNPVVTAAIISGCFAIGSVGLTAYVAVRGFRSTREATDKAVEASSQNTIRALNAARDDRLWEKRATVYEETVAFMLHRQHQRDSPVLHNRTAREKSNATRLGGDYRPAAWRTMQGRLVAYASDVIVAAYKESEDTDNRAFFSWIGWRNAYGVMLKVNPDIEDYDDDPRQLKAKNKLRDAERKAHEKDQVVIDLIRSELHSRPNVQ